MKNHDWLDTETNFQKWTLKQKVRKGTLTPCTPNVWEQGLRLQSAQQQRKLPLISSPSSLFPHPSLLSQSALCSLITPKQTFLRPQSEIVWVKTLPKSNPSLICKFRPADFWMDMIKGEVNCKMQVVGLGTRSRYEGGNPRVNFSLTIYNTALCLEFMRKFQFAELLGIYQIYFLKCKDFHFSTEISPLLHSLGLNIRILTLISAFIFLFFWWR